MKWINRMKSCIDYIEENLKGEIDIAELSRLTFLSKLFKEMLDLCDES